MLRPFVADPEAVERRKKHEYLERRVAGMVGRQMALDDAELRRMLGRWVSGLEPEILRDERGMMLGAGAQGFDAPVIRASDLYKLRWLSLRTE